MMRHQTHRPWRIPSVDSPAVDMLAQQTGLSDIVTRILYARGVRTAEAVSEFLSPSLERDWLDPLLIPGMDEASGRVARAIREKQRILVFGDFDLDGISAAAVATRGLALLGADVSALVPHRFNEGYGLSEAALSRAMARSPQLVVTVDCGISSAVETDWLQSRGVDVVITDHHEPGEGVPHGVPVANPKLNPSGPSRDLAGAGVALKLVQAVGTLLDDSEVWRSLTDLATLGTVADIVSLSGENRALVSDGIARAQAAPRVCLAALIAVAGSSLSALTADTISFALAPRLNAAGRMADPQVALDLLLTDDPAEAEDLARVLDEHNRARQSVEAELTQAATALAERTYGGERVLVLGGEGWHEGVKGIVASRMVGAYHVPAFLFSIDDGVAKGSGRSVGQVDLFRAVEACADIVTRFGGHAAAVGVTLPADDLPKLREALLAHLDTLPAEQFESPLEVDAVVPLDVLSVELGAEIDALAPFGHGNPRPMLATRGVFMNGRSRVGRGSEHLRFVAFDGVASLPAISFRCADIDNLANHDAAVDLAYELGVDEWRGRTRVQLLVRDIAVRSQQEAIGATAELVEDLFARADEILAREEYSGIEDAPSFHTKLAGVTFEGRQGVLERLHPGAPLRLERQPDNPHDPNACAVFDPHGAQVGFLNRRLAAALAAAVDAGVEYDVEVADVTGGDQPGRSLGVNVLVSRRDASALDADEHASRVAVRRELSQLSSEDLDAELTRRFLGNRSLHGAQVQALAALAEGNNTFVVMATGRGKSLIFHLHAARVALREGRASIFVFPLRALVADQSFHLAEVFAEVGLVARTITGESSDSERREAFSSLADGGLDVVLTTPEFLHFHADRFAATGRVGFLVVDEAHHVGQARAGHRPAYGRLGEAAKALGSPTVLAVTATAPDDIAEAIRGSLDIRTSVLDPTVRENLDICDQRGCADKDAYVASLAATGGKLIVYTNSRDKSVQIARMLRKRVPELAFRTAFYNGGLSRSVRHAVEHAFRDGEVQVIVATSAFGEGVNVPDIRNVVLYHLPFNDVEFNQMCGRVGRDGAMARVHLLFGDKDARLNRTILSSLAPERDDLVALYRVLLLLAKAEGEGFEITNAELAQRAAKLKKGFGLDERGVSSGLGIFRDLGLVTGEGHGAYRRLTVISSADKVELGDSVRYAEGLDEIAEFDEFREWVLTAVPEQLLARFNRPILPEDVSQAN